MNEYQENLLDHYSAPHHFGKPGFKPNATAKLQNLSCGDEIEIFLQIKKGIITNITFVGEGCSIAIGAASQLFETIIGKKISDIKNIELDYPEKLIGIPLTMSRKKCASLSIETLKQAIQQYQ